MGQRICVDHILSDDAQATLGANRETRRSTRGDRSEWSGQDRFVPRLVGTASLSGPDPLAAGHADRLRSPKILRGAFSAHHGDGILPSEVAWLLATFDGFHSSSARRNRADGPRPERMQKNLGELSGGQTQRLLIAWALLQKNGVLLLDEPTAGVDAGFEDTAYSIIRRVQTERGTTMLLISHELSVVYRYAQNVFCLNKSSERAFSDAELR